MYELMLVVFILGYACITIEHQLKVDKAAIALVTGVLCWTIYVFGKEEIVQIDNIKNYAEEEFSNICLLYTSPSPRDRTRSRMPSSA